VIDLKIVFLFIASSWLIVAAVVIGYPLMSGRIRAGLNTFSREDDPQAFWKAYMFSTVLFLGVSIAGGIFLHSIFHQRP
jgi:Na+/proline symporter